MVYMLDEGINNLRPKYNKGCAVNRRCVEDIFNKSQ